MEVRMLSQAVAGISPTNPGLLAPGDFPRALSPASSFDRVLHSEEGFCISHHGYADAAFRVEGFSHNCVSIQLAGRARHTRQVGARQGSATSVAGKVFATSAMTPIAWSWNSPAEMINVWISPQRLIHDLAEDGDRGGGSVELIDRFCVDDPLLAQIGVALRFQAAEPRPFGRLMLAGLVSTLVAHIGQHHSNRGAATLAAKSGGLSPAHLKLVLDHIDAHIAEEISLDELAALAGKSACHFLRCFKQSTGISPHRYVTQRRIDHACGLLVADLPLVEIALACGFADQSHFGRVFRRERNLTPMAYRRQAAH
jgi:AraC family transcriptional regulator